MTFLKFGSLDNKNRLDFRMIWISKMDPDPEIDTIFNRSKTKASFKLVLCYL